MLAFHRAGAYPLPQGGSWIDEAVRGVSRAAQTLRDAAAP